MSYGSFTRGTQHAEVTLLNGEYCIAEVTYLLIPISFRIVRIDTVKAGRFCANEDSNFIQVVIFGPHNGTALWTFDCFVVRVSHVVPPYYLLSTD